VEVMRLEILSRSKRSLPDRNREENLADGRKTLFRSNSQPALNSVGANNTAIVRSKDNTTKNRVWKSFITNGHFRLKNRIVLKVNRGIIALLLVVLFNMLLIKLLETLELQEELL